MPQRVKGLEQSKQWCSEFGQEYTDRNTLSTNKLDKLYKNNFGMTRLQLNTLFLGKLPRDTRILEVGSNTGNQLLLLQQMGFKDLWGIEINHYAVENSKRRTNNINIIQASAFDIPFRDKYFDLVFTSGVLIHLAPKYLVQAVKEIHRCSRQYIWGFEYYSEKCEEVVYRGKKSLLWKNNYPKVYTGKFKDLKIKQIKFCKYLQDSNTDVMFMLKKNVPHHQKAA